jgi:hypothetical protein
MRGVVLTQPRYNPESLWRQKHPHVYGDEHRPHCEDPASETWRGWLKDCAKNHNDWNEKETDSEHQKAGEPRQTSCQDSQHAHRSWKDVNPPLPRLLNLQGFSPLTIGYFKYTYSTSHRFSELTQHILRPCLLLTDMLSCVALFIAARGGRTRWRAARQASLETVIEPARALLRASSALAPFREPPRVFRYRNRRPKNACYIVTFAL